MKRFALVEVTEDANGDWHPVGPYDVSRAAALIAVAKVAERASAECSYPGLAIALDNLRYAWPDWDEE